MGHIVVNHLGLPREMMPLYTDKYAGYSERLLDHILAGGNFGQHSATKPKVRKGFWGRKLNTFSRFNRTLTRMWYLSPVDVAGSYAWYTVTGLQRAIKTYKKNKKA